MDGWLLRERTSHREGGGYSLSRCMGSCLGRRQGTGRMAVTASRWMGGFLEREQATGSVAVTVSRWMGSFLEREQATGRVAVTERWMREGRSVGSTARCPRVDGWMLREKTSHREGGGYSTSRWMREGARSGAREPAVPEWMGGCLERRQATGRSESAMCSFFVCSCVGVRPPTLADLFF